MNDLIKGLIVVIVGTILYMILEIIDRIIKKQKKMDVQKMEKEDGYAITIGLWIMSVFVIGLTAIEKGNMNILFLMCWIFPVMIFIELKLK